MRYNKHKYWGFMGLFALIGLKGFTTDNIMWFIFFLNYLWFTLFYERSWVYQYKKYRNIGI